MTPKQLVCPDPESSMLDAASPLTPTSQASTRVSSPGAVTQDSDLAVRLQQAEQTILEKDNRIRSLEQRLATLEGDSQEAYATAADVDAVLRMSELLVRKMLAL